MIDVYLEIIVHLVMFLLGVMLAWPEPGKGVHRWHLVAGATVCFGAVLFGCWRLFEYAT
jgi:hypothetical protein